MIPAACCTLFLLVLAAACGSGAGRSGAGAAGRPCDAPRAVAADTVIRVGSGWPDGLLRRVAGDGPRFPAALRDRNVSGIVRATFVVDTTGRVAPGSARIVLETERAFGDAVCASLAGVQFTPAVVAGRRLAVRIDDAVTRFDLTR